MFDGDIWSYMFRIRNALGLITTKSSLKWRHDNSVIAIIEGYQNGIQSTIDNYTTRGQTWGEIKTNCLERANTIAVKQ